MPSLLSRLVAGAALVLACAVPVLAAAQTEGPLPPLTFDRIDDPSTVWRLSDYVVTTDTAPSAAAPVYIQFGFMGCAPCEVLAQEVNASLGDDVVRLYVHLDDVLLQREYGGSNQALWRALWTYAQDAPYDTFTVARRGSTNLMHELCGPGTNAPTGLLVLPDGAVFEILTSGDVEVARDAFTRFQAAYTAGADAPAELGDSVAPAGDEAAEEDEGGTTP